MSNLDVGEQGSNEVVDLPAVPTVTTGVSQGLPPLYRLLWLNVQPLYYAGSRVAFECAVTDVNGNNVPVPSQIVAQLLDNNGLPLSAPVVAGMEYDDKAVPAAQQIIGAILPLAAQGAYKVEVQGTFDDGTGAQIHKARLDIRVYA